MAAPPSGPDPTRAADELRRFAAERVGPCAAGYLADGAICARLAAALRAGTDLEDCILGEIHRAASADRALAAEFLGYFLGDLMRIGRGTLSAALHRHVDTGDLVQSVLGDVWPALSEVRFETRGQFLALLTRRLDWKAAGKARKLRGERHAAEEESIPVEQVPQRQPSPLTELAAEESYEHTLLKLLRLGERDRELLALHLEGAPVERVAAELGLSRAAAYKALQRAIQRFRALP